MPRGEPRHDRRVSNLVARRSPSRVDELGRRPEPLEIGCQVQERVDRRGLVEGHPREVGAERRTGAGAATTMAAERTATRVRDERVTRTREVDGTGGRPGVAARVQEHAAVDAPNRGTVGRLENDVASHGPDSVRKAARQHDVADEVGVGAAVGHGRVGLGHDRRGRAGPVAVGRGTVDDDVGPSVVRARAAAALSESTAITGVPRRSAHRRRCTAGAGGVRRRVRRISTAGERDRGRRRGDERAPEHGAEPTTLAFHSRRPRNSPHDVPSSPAQGPEKDIEPAARRQRTRRS